VIHDVGWGLPHQKLAYILKYFGGASPTLQLKTLPILDAGWSPKSLDLGVKKNNQLKKLLTPKSKDLG